MFRRRFGVLFRRCVPALLAWGLAAAAFGLDPDRAPSQYVTRHWGVQTLRGNGVYALLQTRDRYVWAGTSTGLLHYDGDRFVLFNAANTPNFSDAGVTSLAEAPNGSLFVGTTAGLVLRYRDGAFGQATPVRAPGAISSLVVARDGSLWIGSQGIDVTVLRGDAVVPAELPVHAPEAMIVDPAGAVLVATKESGLIRASGRVRTALHWTDQAVQALYFDRAGTLWIGTPAGLVRVREGTADRITGQEGLPHENVTVILEDKDRNLWVGTGGGGLARLTRGVWTQLTSSFDGLSDNDVRALMEDHEGNLWIGTAGGLTCLSDAPFMTFGRAEGFADAAITSVAPSQDGSLWIGTASGQVSRFRDGKQIQPFSLAGGRSRDSVLALREMRDGSLWAMVDSRRLLKVQNGVISNETVPPPPIRHAPALFEDEKGPLFMVTGLGLSRLANHRFTTIFPGRPSPDDQYPRYPHMGLRDSHGAFWLADVVGLARFQEGRWSFWDVGRGLANNRVRWISEEPTGGVWTAGLGGLSYVKGEEPARAITVNHGLPETYLRLVLDDGLGYLWIASASYIFRVEKREIFDLFAGKRPKVAPRVFDISDGLRTTEILLSNNPGVRMPDGRLWFATAKGLSVVDPRRLARPLPPPAVQLEELRVDDAALDVKEAVSAPPGRGDLAIRYTAPSYTAPERLHFRYQLEGYDADFVDAGTRRVAYYTNIPPARYHFRVAARSGDGPWGATQSVELYLAPHYYQTGWFRAAGLLTVVLLLASVYRARVGYLKEREKELSKRVDEGLAQITILQGILPTCASCRRIRDEKDSWSDMESYITAHSEANFSHGICPDCMARLYPEYSGIK